MNTKNTETTTQPTVHTPTPWEADKYFPLLANFRDANGTPLFVVEGENAHAIAALIVRAVNSHAALVAINAELLSIADFVANELPGLIRQSCPNGVPMSIASLHDSARAVLARAEAMKGGVL